MTKQVINNLLIIVSLVIMVVAAVNNIGLIDSRDGPSMINLALTIGYTLVWTAILILGRKNKGIMIYSSIVSGITLLHVEEFCFGFLNEHFTFLSEALFVLSNLFWLWILLIGPWLGFIWNHKLDIAILPVLIWFVVSIINVKKCGRI